MKNKQKIIVILGPTASGKSDLAVQLAKKFNGEIISADSRQVYRGMDIGTGKIPRDKLLNKYDRIYLAMGIRHHLIDIVSPKKVFTVSDFKSQAERAISDIIKRGKLPIIVGGTGLYIDALIYDIDIPEVPPNPLLRLNLNKFTAEKLYQKLKKRDPERSKTIDPHNKVRVIRALEIIDSLGKVPFLNTHYSLLATRYNVLWLGLNPKNLEKRIAIRVNQRLKKGAIKEVKNLIQNRVTKKRIYDFGLSYRAIIKFLDTKIDKQTMVKEFMRSEIQYAKRQMTWFKRNKKIKWLSKNNQALPLLDKFIKKSINKTGA